MLKLSIILAILHTVLSSSLFLGECLVDPSHSHVGGQDMFIFCKLDKKDTSRTGKQLWVVVALKRSCVAGYCLARSAHFSADIMLTSLI